MTHLFLTGAAGFVAPYVIERACARGWSIVTTDTRQPKWPAWLSTRGVSFEQADVQDRDAMARLAEGADVIVHSAAVVGPVSANSDRFRATKVNVLGSQTIFDVAIAQRLAVINISTATLYGTRPDLATLGETDPVDPVSHYDATKFMAEIMAGSYRKSFGLNIASLRTSFVYGQGHSTGEYFVDRLLRGEAVRLPNGTDSPCDFTYVVDLAEGIVRAAANAPLPEPVYNLSGGRLHTRGEFLAAVKRALPGCDAQLGAGRNPALHLRGPCSLARAKRDFGFEPTYDLDAGIADWIRRERQSEPQDSS